MMQQGQTMMQQGDFGTRGGQELLMSNSVELVQNDGCRLLCCKNNTFNVYKNVGPKPSFPKQILKAKERDTDFM